MTSFAKTGKPDHPHLPEWPVYRREDLMTMRFDRDWTGQRSRRTQLA